MGRSNKSQMASSSVDSKGELWGERKDDMRQTYHRNLHIHG